IWPPPGDGGEGARGQVSGDRCQVSGIRLRNLAHHSCALDRNLPPGNLAPAHSRIQSAREEKKTPRTPPGPLSSGAVGSAHRASAKKMPHPQAESLEVRQKQSERSPLGESDYSRPLQKR